MGLFASKPANPIGFAPPAPSGISIGKILTVTIGMIFLGVLGLVIYNYVRASQGQPTVSLFPSSGASSSGDQTPSPIDGKTRTVISASNVPLSVGSDYGVQFWMYIKDWDYKFGAEKQVLKRVDPTKGGNINPSITLHPTDNSLNVSVSVYPTDMKAGAAKPGANTTGDVFTCSVENVPLQSWFSVSVTVFQRNLDIYINGQLVKSCILPGVPKPATGDIILNDAGGFSGSICNVHSYSSILNPADAKAFFSAGTTCNTPAPTTPSPPGANNTFITLFGYTFRFSTLDKSGNELSSYTF
jgi:Concanavalin A-like lectin/glucanases superfamily